MIRNILLKAMHHRAIGGWRATPTARRVAALLAPDPRLRSQAIIAVQDTLMRKGKAGIGLRDLAPVEPGFRFASERGEPMTQPALSRDRDALRRYS
jgi:hypothetical protein